MSASRSMKVRRSLAIRLIETHLRSIDDEGLASILNQAMTIHYPLVNFEISVGGHRFIDQIDKDLYGGEA